MAKSTYSQQNPVNKLKVGFQHVAILGVLIVAFFFFFQLQLIPYGVSSFVVPLFKPSPEKLTKMGFVQFEGLTWASTSLEKQELVTRQGRVAIKKDLIDREYIFDFTLNKRTDKEHGYVKNSNEFYVKSETLGEFPIYLEPWIGFWILSLVLGVVCSIFITMFLPLNLGFMALLFDRQINETQIKIRLQTNLTDDLVLMLTLPDSKLYEIERNDVEKAFRTIWDSTNLEQSGANPHLQRFENSFDDNTDVVQFRNNELYNRIKEYYSDFLLKEIEDTRDGLEWRGNHFKIMSGLRLYMAHHFTEKYSNNVTGLAYGGAAVLIVAVGIRGLKFIPATRPSMIMLAIFLEFSMLSLLAVTLVYTEEEERMDKMLKKMEDANRNQLESLEMQRFDIHQLSEALVGQSKEIIKNRVQAAISEYMTSDDNVKRVIAEQISDKIMIGLRDSFSDGGHAGKDHFRRQ